MQVYEVCEDILPFKCLDSPDERIFVLFKHRLQKLSIELIIRAFTIYCIIEMKRNSICLSIIPNGGPGTSLNI